MHSDTQPKVRFHLPLPTNLVLPYNQIEIATLSLRSSILALSVSGNRHVVPVSRSNCAVLPHKPLHEPVVGVGAGKRLCCLSVKENKGKEEEVGHPSLDTWWVGGEEHIVLEPWNVSADNHNTEGDSDTIECSAVVV